VRWLVVGLAVAVAVFWGGGAGCSGKGRQKRSGDAAPVEIVTGPSVSDGSVGGAATSEEIEPNDGEDVATPLAPGATVRGKIDPDTDTDHYRIDVTQAGVLAIELTAPDGVDLTLEVEDPSGTVIARSDRGGVRVKEGVPNVGVTAGRYIATVRAKKIVAPVKKLPRGKKAPPPDAGVPAVAPVYEITAKVVPVVGNVEHEPDDDRGTAIDLIVGDPATGYIGWTGDADVWKLSVETLSAKNAIDVEVSAIEGVALSVEIADGIGHPLVTRKAPRGAPLVLRGLVPVVPAGAPPFHYLTIRGDKSNPETPYQLRVTAKVPGTDAEVEPNDTVDKAMAIPAERTVVQATWSPGDVDCFAIAPDQAARTIDGTIETRTELDFSGELFVDGTSIAKGNRGGKGASERVSGTVPAGARAVICVRASDVAGEGGYELKISEGPAAGP
jgi:hypothetical protein